MNKGGGNLFFQKNLKYLRIKDNLSYRELEKLSGVTYSIIYNIEHFKIKDPSLSSVIKLSNAFNIDISTLLFTDLEEKE